MPDEEGNEYARRLGAEMRNRRLARGLSLRELARLLYLSGHGTLVDYELGRRIAPLNIVEGCERVFQISDGALRNLREKALAERAGRESDRLLRESAGPEEETPRSAQPPGAASLAPPEEPPDGGAAAKAADEASPKRRFRHSAVVAAAVLVAVAATGLVTGLDRRHHGPVGTAAPPSTGSSPSADASLSADSSPSTGSAPVRIDFGQSTDRWGVFWGNQVAQVQVTTVTAYHGTHSLQFTVTGATNTRGPAAIGTTHELTGLAPGMKVTFWLQVSAPEPGSGVRFWAYDSRSTAVFAPETPNPGTEKPLPTGTGWQPYVWTVPKVDTVHAIGMQLYSASEQPVIVWLGGVSW